MNLLMSSVQVIPSIVELSIREPVQKLPGHTQPASSGAPAERCDVYIN